MTEAKAVSHLADKTAQHLACDFEVENRSAVNGPVYFNPTRLTAQQLQGLVTNRDDLSVVTVHCNNRRLIQEDSLPGLINECVDGAQIYSNLVSKKLLDKP